MSSANKIAANELADEILDELPDAVVSDAVAETDDTYERLGLRPVINAAATLTKLGGSLVAPPVVPVMAAAARSFVDVPELNRRIGERIAELTGNEAVYISSGAAAGIVVAIAACITGDDPAMIPVFPYLEGVEKTEVIVHRTQRNGYDYAARQTGVRLVEVDNSIDALEAAISEKTVAVLWFAGLLASESPPLEEVLVVAHARGVPVLVDAAAQIPPVSNLWYFTRDLGADLVIFSGGKGLRGPQSSGLVMGRADLIAGCRINGSPNHSIGRPMKVGKEELCGLLAAVEWAVEQDEPAVLAGYEATVQGWIAALGDLPGVTAERGYPSEAGQPHSRAILHVGPEAALSRDALVTALWEGEPCIAVSAIGEDAVALNPQPLEPGEAEIVRERIAALLSV